MELNSKKYHNILANYFDKSHLLYFDENIQKKPNIRKCIELPYQQILAQRNDIFETLDSSDFIEAKLKGKLHKSLIKDYELTQGIYGALDNNLKLLLSNLSNLIKYPSQLLNLLYHIGNNHLKEKVKESIKSRPENQFFLLTEKEEYYKNITIESTDSKNISIQYRQEYQTSKSTVAAQKELLFGIKQIGKLYAIDINRGIEYYVNIKLPSENPETIKVSENGDYIVFAYINQTAAIYKLDYSAYSIKGEPAGNVDYKLPEFDPPVFSFIDGTLIYQKQDGSIVKYDLDKKTVDVINFTGFPVSEIELATVDSSSEYLVIGLRHFSNSFISLVENNEVVDNYKFDDILQCSTITADNELIVCTLDKKLFHFTLGENKISLKKVISLPEAPIDCVFGNNTILVHLRPNLSLIYHPQAKLKSIEGIPGNIGIIREIKFIKNNKFVIASSSQFITFSIGGTSNQKLLEIITSITRSDSSYLLLLKHNHEKILYDSKTKSQKTFNEIKNSYINETFLSIDGEDNILHIYLEGIGYLYNSLKKEWTKIKNIPTDTVSLAGNFESGFWLATKSGKIFSVDVFGKLKLQDTISEDIVNTGNIKVFKNILTWNGIVLKSGKFGTDFICQIRFYEIQGAKTSLSLNPIGDNRVFETHNGLIDAVCYNENTQLFYIFLFSDKEYDNQAVRIGTINDFLRHKEKKKPIEGLDQSVNYCKLHTQKNECLINGKQNGLFLIDLQSFEAISFLQPNVGIIKMSQGISGEGTYISNSNNELQKINKINGGN